MTLFYESLSHIAIKIMYCEIAVRIYNLFISKYLKILERQPQHSNSLRRNFALQFSDFSYNILSILQLEVGDDSNRAVLRVS